MPPTVESKHKNFFATTSLIVYRGFFFSSRRRHTRCLSDWSSDVCSSDLPTFGRPTTATWTGTWGFEAGDAGVRSEERRVGKECRYRWSPQQLKKKSRTSTKL